VREPTDASEDYPLEIGSGKMFLRYRSRQFLLSFEDLSTSSPRRGVAYLRRKRPCANRRTSCFRYHVQSPIYVEADSSCSILWFFGPFAKVECGACPAACRLC